MTEVHAEAPARRRGRPPVNRESVRDPQPRRAIRADQRTPAGRMRVSDDLFWYDQSRQPEGMDYQWNLDTIMGMPDPKNQMGAMMRNGWTPVPAERHPEIAAHLKPGEAIRIGGQILMERAAEMTEEAKQEDRDRAYKQVTDNFHRLQLDDKDMLPKRRRDGQSMVRIKKEAPIQVSEGAGNEYERE